MSKSAIFTIRPVAAAVLAVATFGAPVAAQASELTGNIGVFSKYVLRGNTAASENAGASLQGGFDYEHNSGFYLGWWGASLGYEGEDVDAEFENDFYAGWAGEFGGFSVGAGLVYYYYMDTDDADAGEVALSIGYGPVSLGVNYLLQDVVWGNAGDTYLTLGFETALPYNLTFGATAGYYIYSDSGDFEDDLATTEDDAFRHLDLTLSTPIGDTGAEMSVTYILGGKLRDGTDLGNTVVLGLTYAFDL